MHGFTRGYWNKMRELGMFEFIESAISSGKIKYIGFSFHDDITVFKEIIDGYDWDFCMIQYNFMDEDYQAGKQGLQYAAQKGIDVAIMEPLRGGNLVQVPETVQRIWDSAKIKRTPANWCFQYLWDQPEISIVLSGMSTFEQVEQNIAYAEKGIPAAFTYLNSASMYGNVEKASFQYGLFVPPEEAASMCTECGLCEEHCPQHIRIREMLKRVVEVLEEND
jgi:predicted aldo/keto reductase-like oxidoreductase